MSWGARQLQWLNINYLEKMKNLDLLLDSNPVINPKIKSNTLNRACGINQSSLHDFVRRQVVWLVANPPDKYKTDREFQEALERSITGRLAEKHYAYYLGLPANSSFSIKPKEFWWIASYYVCRKERKDKKKTLFRFHFFNQTFFHNEFYGLPGARVHPAVVIECKSNNLFLMVPYSSERSSGSIKMSISRNPKIKSFAIYKFYFYTTWAMCDGKRAGNKIISDVDFNKIVGAISDFI